MDFKVGDIVTYKGIMSERHGWVGKVIEIIDSKHYPIKVEWGRTWVMGTSCACKVNSLELTPFGMRKHIKKHTFRI